MKRIVGWLLSSSIFASFCALALCLGAEELLLAHHAAKAFGINYDVQSWNHPLHFLVFGATLLEYNAHFLLNTKGTGIPVLGAYLLALTGGSLCAMALPGMPLTVMILLGSLGLLAVLYSTPYIPFRPKRRINDYGITKILVLTVTWVAMTTILPSLYLGFTWHVLSHEIVLRTLLIFPLCLAFDLRDYESDKAKGIQTIAGALGEVKSYKIIYINLLILIVTGLIFLFTGAIIFPHFIAVAVAALLAFCSVRFARKAQHPFIYSGLIDGVMLVYGLLVWVLL